MKAFLPLPIDEVLQVAWPTPNHFLLAAPEKFFARTRLNADYGKPGWTRDCSKRFHRGADIAPVNVTATGQETHVIFTDCQTGRDFISREATFTPHDDVFCVCAGRVVEAVTDERLSNFGKHVVIEHRWPVSGAPFFTLYGHLAELAIDRERRQIKSGQRIGRMGQTSRNPDARNWMLIAPHMHFEVRTADGEPYDPAEFLRRFAAR